MRYHELKERIIAADKVKDELAKIASRSWLCPDGSLICVDIRPQFEGGPIGFLGAVAITFSRWVKDESASVTLPNGREVRGGYWDHVDRWERCTSVQLEYLKIARKMCEDYVAGIVEHLPDTLF